jgi:hypothetical protein
MEMILLDWTRIGKSYCLAGAVLDGGRLRIVRPLMARCRDAPVRNVGWSPYLLDGHTRWEVFELIGPHAALPEAPHLEDIWVRSLRPRHCLAPPGQRRETLAATVAPEGEAVFGGPLIPTRAAAYLEPGTGRRSLATITVPADSIRFSASRRDGVAEADVRVSVTLPGLGERLLPIKDHHLLCRAEQRAVDLDRQISALNRAVQAMGQRVAVRLGVSRSFQPADQRAPAKCWLMVDGLFSTTDPQP